MQRVYEENEWGKVCKRIITVPLSILQGSQTCYDQVISEKKVTRPGIVPRTFPLLGGRSTN